MLALGGVVVREGGPRIPIRFCRLMRFRACLYRRGIVVEASSPRGGGGFAAFPGPSEKWPEIAQIMSIITASALNAMRTCVPREPLAANALSKDRTSRALPFGNNATRWAAIILEGMAFAGARGSASISSVNRAAAASLGIRARLVASCQGSTLRRANAERTLSPVPFRSSPIDAPRNLSNSGSMSGDSAAWVISLPLPFRFAPRSGHKLAPLRAPFESLAPDPIHGRAFE